MPKLDLKISQPARLLNRIAQRYARVSRILMEYVDNSLDDAETFYNRATSTYKKLVKVKIILIHSPKTVVILDNCNGMTKKQLTRLIQNVGESQKHSKFTNGQFGFGVHAFRAACKKLSILSKTNNGETYMLIIDRESANFHRPKISPTKIKTVSGTQIILQDFDDSWVEGLTQTEIQNEIQYHFDGLLRRNNLAIGVQTKKSLGICRPLRYRSSEGKKLRKKLQIEGQLIKVSLWVSNTPVKNQSCYFTSNGRRINEIYEVKSFMNKSLARYKVWSHPHVTGYIEVGDFVQPVITRDEFVQTRKRAVLYRRIVQDIEPMLVKMVDEANAERHTVEMGRLGNILSKCFNQAINKESRRMEGQASYVEQVIRDPVTRVGKRKLPPEWTDDLENQEAQGEQPEEPPVLGEVDKNKKNKAKRQKREKKINKLKKVQGRFAMKFVNDLKDPEGNIERSCLIGDDMLINISHPDFQERMMKSKSGSRVQITSRLNSYIGNVSATAYKLAILQRSTQGLLTYSQDHTPLFSEVTDLALSLERQLSKYLPAIQKEIRGTA